MLKSDRAHGWPGKAARDWPHPAAEDQGKTFPINELLRASECINGASTKPLVGLQSSFCMGSEMDSVLTGSQGRHIPHHLLFMKVKKVN